MGTILASALIAKSRLILNDTATRYTDAELLGWLNDGQRDLSEMRIDSCITLGVMPLVAGTQQTLPANGKALVRVTRYMGTGGTTPGNAVRQVSHDLMDAQNANWHNDTPTAAPVHYVAHPQLPRTFYVYPPSDATGRVEVMYAALPTDLTVTSQAIALDDMYAIPLIDYILFRAFAKDDGDPNEGRATAHREAYERALGLGAQMAATANAGG